MSSAERNQTPDGDDLAEAQSTDLQPQMTVHPVNGYSSMPMHMYPFPPGLVATQPLRSKRRQVKNACTNCQKACKKCDDARPCLRCVKYGIAEECVDSQRKERKKGVKRGPYKKRDGKGTNADIGDVPEQPSIPVTTEVPTQSASPPLQATYMAPIGYSMFPGQFPGSPTPKPGEASPAYYPQFYAITPMPHPGQNGHPGQDPEQGYPSMAQYIPAAFLPYAPQSYGYMYPHRPDGQMQMMNPHYAPYPQMYGKPPSAGGSSDSGHLNGRNHGDD
ncbi:hypothetical protein BDR04DRAFT_1090927 [Suillus decipiens]|nr:hypothetical protein BDR04DRAFT_1090927 [Suillus decipiens]